MYTHRPVVHCKHVRFVVFQTILSYFAIYYLTCIEHLYMCDILGNLFHVFSEFESVLIYNQINNTGRENDAKKNRDIM